MHVAVIGTIHDFPAHGDVSGWRTKGYLASPTCNDSPLSQKLINKIGWVGHRAYLPENHPWRKDKKFDGSYEFAKKSFELSVEKVKAQLDRLRPVEFGKDTIGSKRSRHPTELNWTKKSLLWELPYFESLLIRHFLDVMHIEKNICESIYGTMLSIDGKNKDTYKAREDLKQRGVRPELHLQIIENGSIVKPRATYTLDPHQVERFYEFLKSIRYPDGYVANISRCVTSENGRLLGMKSHDYHVLLQRLLPIGMRGFVSKEICTTFFELGNFFEELCSKTLRRSDMEKWEEQVVLILCKLERIFPPAFFDVMVHLTVHLSREAMIAGPVQYRWMYPIERMEIFDQHVRLFSPIIGAPEPSKKEREMAHWFVLYNCPEVEPYLEEHKNMLQNPQGHDVLEIQRKEFPNWFKKRMNDLRTQGSEEATKELWSLANGPGSIIDLYSGCICNGVRFHTKDRENRRMCQNSGIAIEGVYKGENVNFYGYLNKIWELRYVHGGRVVLFQCEWYNTGRKSKIYTDEHVTNIDITRLWFKKDPFVLPHNVRQVFYINDTSKGKNWRVEETVDGGVPISVEDIEVQYNRDNVNLETIPNDDFMAVHVDDQDNEDDMMVEYMDAEDDDLSGQNDLDDSDVDLDVDYDI
ncbi:hypothetical protein Vadar_031230 [Vaccinium darrowii]|uniref:Uncharacterized protein n=1 Tax=Vaccinium darrowii TaxID=229202 RepID=A0ACB7XDF0_9ERIC|nr:hypothetical protein Vadar_031230 [Vaccinium darrowii]